MSFFDEIEVEEPILKTDLAAPDHPVATEDQARKCDYLSLVALIIQVDNETHPLEAAIIRDLASALGLTEKHIQLAASFSEEQDRTAISNSLGLWKGSPHRYLLFVDLCRVSHADEQVHERERKALNWFARQLGLRDSQRDALFEFALWLRSASDVDNDRYKTLLQDEGIDPGPLRFLVNQRIKKTEQTQKVLEEQERHRPTRAESLSLQVVRQAQEDVLSSLANLAKTIEKCRPKGEGRYALGSQEDINRYLAVVEEERHKVEQLRMTLAVIGPLKAGKSTLINAIIGDHVLPARKSAMTALPTLITHTDGQAKPILRFDKPEPFNDLIRQIGGGT